MIGSVNLKAKGTPRKLVGSDLGSEVRSGRLRLLTKETPLQTESLLISVEGTISSATGLSGRRVRDFPSQEELVGELYSKYGASFVERLDGLFFVFLWDKSEDTYLLCNNAYQTTTLYFHQSDDRLLFSKHLTDIVRNLPGAIDVDLSSVKTYLANGFNMSDQTVVGGIRKLLPTFRIQVQKGRVSLVNHWSNELPFERRPFSNLETHLDEYEDLFRRGIRDYVEHNKAEELGCLMSGGHDTSFAFIQGSQVFDKPLHAFTATFPGWNFNEESSSQNICEKFGGIFHPVPFVSDDLDYMVALTRALEEPMASSALPIHLVMKEASKHVDLMMGGDGGDTLWAEYHPVAEVNRYLKNVPLGIRRLLHKLTKGIRRVSDSERWWELEHVASLFADEDVYGDFLRRLCTYRHFRDDLVQEIMEESVYRENPYARSILDIQHTRDNLNDNLIESKLFNGFYPYMSFYTTKSSEHYGMDLFLPTVTRDLMRFITSLPDEWVNGGTTFHRLTNSKRYNRRFHKAALARYLKKEEIRNLSFDIPWYRILLPRPRVLDLLLERLIQRGWFNEKALSNLFAEFRSQPVNENLLLQLRNHGYRVFTLLSLEIWCIEYVDGRLTENPEERINLETYLE